MSLDVEDIRKDFPVVKEKIEGERLVYLDNAATSHKPERVVKRMEEYFYRENSNVGRSLHELARRSTEAYENSRERIASFIGASTDELIFVRNATEGINLAAESLDIEGDVVVPEMSHHSNQLPWRRVAERKGSDVKYIPTKGNKLDLEAAKDIINKNTGIVSVSHVSNVFGCKNPVKKITEIAHENDALALVDGAQSVPRMPTDVKDIGADFLTFSGHKMCGPMGIGGLYVRREIMEKMEPYQVGGGMVRTVTKDDMVPSELPGMFEAGTPNVSGAVGLAEATRYLEDVGMENIWKHEVKLSQKMRRGLDSIDGVKIYAPEKEISLISFTMEQAHPHDISEILNRNGVAIRAGHHCAQPQMNTLGLNGTARASPYLYNTEEDVDKLIKAVEEVNKVFG